MYAIQTHQLTKSYGKHRGIENLNLTVQQGELFGFIGPNGAGKSTTIRTLLGLIKPTSGSAQVLGLEVGGQQGQILRRVGYLPSETQFYAGMTARYLLKLSADLRGLDCQAECRRLSDRLQLDLGIAADQLSLGNRKKVGIVAALQHQPDLLILDEPT
ncbi:MAG: ABC transporter ATP-binding protein, partial [Abiotrophia defectiva]|nr:ABC transporter ATP-binding protein [Abiotrophia defectiva]